MVLSKYVGGFDNLILKFFISIKD